ncbi:MAG: DUF4359 domain-containing protein [Synechococcales cyanobacterium C42_A2020_086]|jgi:hypothetical protein|nr:DUF4359 domain-containing protein [Synechococcales cyanobacterium M58_A2018_015]MBF2074802.1 DUF4359 domain-containing protein [Synechococcales cyanobacterium C42_A2020_086]
MKSVKVGAFLTAMAVVGLGGAMAATNPDPAAYNAFAAQRLAQYLQDEECVKLDANIRGVCDVLDQPQGQDLIKRLVDTNTQRQNYGVLSIYKTNLSTASLLPDFLSGLLSVPSVSYQVETVGVFNQFYIYRAERQNE